jgi:hypothetical protein
MKHLGVDLFPVLHQWHPKQSPCDTSPWYLETINRLYSVETNRKRNEIYGMQVDTTSRNVLKLLDNKGTFKKLALMEHQLFKFNLFLIGFLEMASGEFGQFEFIIPLPIPEGRKQKIVNKLNKLLVKWNFPWNLTTNKLQVAINTKEGWFDFVTYFVGKNRAFLKDYYLFESSEKMVFYFEKK